MSSSDNTAKTFPVDDARRPRLFRVGHLKAPLRTPRANDDDDDDDDDDDEHVATGDVRQEKNMQLDAIEHDAMVPFSMRVCTLARRRSRGNEITQNEDNVLRDESHLFPQKETAGADREKERRRWSWRGKEIRDYASFFLHHNSSFGRRRSSSEGSRR